ncbi:MAG: DUF5916 domain-containing protein [Bacteroidota bacterium]
MHRIISSLILLTVIAFFPLVAGENINAIRAVKIETSPRIDGLLDEQIWQQASPATDFLQRDPSEGQPASERTEVRVLYDDDALYFGFMLFDSEPGNIVAPLTRRDNVVESDGMSIYIDAFHDHQTCYEFGFNPAGVKSDILIYNDGDIEDNSWDAVWEVETRILPNGWSAEVRIPFRVLRYQLADNDTSEYEWGMNFIRTISRKQEEDRWAFTPKKESGFVSRFGHLRGLRALPSPRQLELLPFVVGKQRWQPQRPNQDRLAEFSTDAGMDFKYSISNNFTLDATINPDFGQVEADPEVLNLSTFETFYPEKRPFFIEGTQILRFTTFGGALGPGMFYPRRIGRAISPFEVAVPTGGKIEELPQAVTILGAAKVNGKTNGGLSVGVLQAFTEEEEAEVSDATGARSSQVLEPFGHYNVVRLKQDVLGNSNVGLVLTTVAKPDRAPAITNGYDWFIKLADNTYLCEGFFAHTHTNDGTGKRIHGSGGRFGFTRTAAEHWLWSFGGRYATQRYNINDLGFFFRPDGFTGLFSLTYKENTPAGLYRNYSVTFSFTEFHNMHGVGLQREGRLDASTLFSNYWSASASASADIGRYDDRETRGNGLYQKPEFYNTSLTLSSDGREDLIGRFTSRYGWDSKLRSQWASLLGLTLKPTTWMQWELSGEYERVLNQEAWVTHSSGSIFADRSTDRFDMTLRSTITFTRDLTLQVYTQIFSAKARHGLARQLIGTTDFVPSSYAASAHNFTAQEFNSNFVLRWEYLPGSTLFFVWSQARQGSKGIYSDSFSDDINDTFRLPPSNVLLLKATYWLSL